MYWPCKRNSHLRKSDFNLRIVRFSGHGLALCIRTTGPGGQSPVWGIQVSVMRHPVKYEFRMTVNFFVTVQKQYHLLVCLFVFCATAPHWVRSSSFTMFVDLITHNDAPQAVGLLWTSEQPVAETSTWQHTTPTTDKHAYPRWYSNPQSQQASGRRPTP